MSMKKISYHILRVGLGITFIWIGIMVLQNPAGWLGMVQPWAAAILPDSPQQAMMGTAILDLVVGAFLIIDVFTGIAGLIGSIHIVIVLIVVGINAATVRDIGLLAGTLAVFFDKKWRR